MCRRALSVCAAVPQSSGFEWTSACCVRYTHLSSYNPSPMAACMRHVHKHNLSPAARQSRGRTSGPRRARPICTHRHTCSSRDTDEDRRENYRRERVREARALRGSRRRSAPAEARRMCDDSFHIIMSRATQPAHGREPDRARDTARPSTRPRCYTDRKDAMPP